VQGAEFEGSEFEDSDNLRLTFATWVVALCAQGVSPTNEAMGGLAAAVVASGDDVAALALVRAVADRLPAGAGPDAVASLGADLFGDRAHGAMGQGDRRTRLQRIRKYQFGRQLPWLARIWERLSDGTVGPSWLLVEQITDQVVAMDFNPWNDIDEARLLPVGDFQVLWELDGCTALAIR